MELIPVASAKEGMRVAREVRDARGRILLVRGQRLTSSGLDRLYRFQVERIYIGDNFGEEDPKALKQEMKQYCEEALADSFRAFHSEAKIKRYAIDAAAMQSLTDMLIGALLSNRDPIVSLLDLVNGSSGLTSHSVSSAILAILMGRKLGVSADMLHHLGAAMMFHDIGFLFLPEDAQRAENEASRKHVALGAAHLMKANYVSSIAGNIVLRHHERIDGTGFPSGANGDTLSILCRIAAVAEAYDTMVTPKNGAPMTLPDTAVSHLLQHAGTWYAKDAVSALCQCIALYPTGTAVELNTGERGVVIANSPQNPLKPTLRLVSDHRGTVITKQPIYDLSRDTGRYIRKSAPTLPELGKRAA